MKKIFLAMSMVFIMIIPMITCAKASTSVNEGDFIDAWVADTSTLKIDVPFVVAGEDILEMINMLKYATFCIEEGTLDIIDNQSCTEDSFATYLSDGILYVDIPEEDLLTISFIRQEECLLFNIEVRAVGYKISCELYPVYEMYQAPDD